MNANNKETIILKSRDDKEPVYLMPSDEGKFKFIDDQQVAWKKDEIDLLDLRH